MAGGEGRRLRPLTETRPKPLMPVAGQPAMSHILRLLKKHGVDGATVTTGYLAEVIENYYGAEFDGMPLKYVRESTPLGSAGGVRMAAEDFEDDFIVISGDAVCELDLSRAYEFHRCSKADATILLTRVENPLEYGAVLCGSGGKIEGFVEKPSLSQAYTDCVNTGVYILSPRIKDMIPKNEFYDFGADLFPRMLKENKHLFGITDESYWCDIGDLEAYRLANMYYSSGETVVGHRCEIKGTARCSESVIMDGCTVGAGSRITKSVIGEGCVIGENAVVGEGCVIGDGSTVGEGAFLAPQTKLSAFSKIPAGYIKRDPSLFGDYRSAQKIFFGNRLAYRENTEGTHFTVGVGCAVAAAAGSGSRIGVMHSGGYHESRACGLLIKGLKLGGAEPVALGEGFEASCSQAPHLIDLSYSLFVRYRDGMIEIYPYDRDGLYPHRHFERALTSALVSTQLPETADGEIGRVPTVDFTENCYFPLLVARYKPFTDFGATVLPENYPSQLLRRALIQLGAETSRSTVFSLSDDGFSVKAKSGGCTADMNHMMAAILAAEPRGEYTPKALPHSAPLMLKQLAGKKAHLYSHCPHDNSEDESRRLVKYRPELRDGCFCALKIASLLDSGKSLQSICSAYPPFSFIREALTVPEGFGKIRIMESLGKPSGDGVYMQYERGGVRVVAGRYGYSLSSESADGEYAEEIMTISKRKIAEFIDKNRG